MTRDRPLFLLGLWSLALAAALLALGIWTRLPILIVLFALLAVAKLYTGVRLIRASREVMP